MTMKSNFLILYGSITSSNSLFIKAQRYNSNNNLSTTKSNQNQNQPKFNNNNELN